MPNALGSGTVSGSLNSMPSSEGSGTNTRTGTTGATGAGGFGAGRTATGAGWGCVRGWGRGCAKYGCGCGAKP